MVSSWNRLRKQIHRKTEITGMDEFFNKYGLDGMSGIFGNPGPTSPRNKWGSLAGKRVLTTYPKPAKLFE